MIPLSSFLDPNGADNAPSMAALLVFRINGGGYTLPGNRLRLEGARFMIGANTLSAQSTASRQMREHRSSSNRATSRPSRGGCLVLPLLYPRQETSGLYRSKREGMDE